MNILPGVGDGCFVMNLFERVKGWYGLVWSVPMDLKLGVIRCGPSLHSPNYV